jgi:hypothetical protein
MGFQELVSQCCSPQECSRIFFESVEDNVKKLSQIMRKYFKRNKEYILRVDEI